MDYLREIQRRQDALLRRLLMGRMEQRQEETLQGAAAAEELREETAAEVRRRTWRTSEEASAAREKGDSRAAETVKTVEKMGDEVPMEKRNGNRGDATECAVETGNGAELPTHYGHNRARTERAEMQSGGALFEKTMEEQRTRFFQTRRADTLWRNGGHWGEGGAFVLWEDRGETMDAECVSRTVQRDARRYDGGFTMY